MDITPIYIMDLYLKNTDNIAQLRFRKSFMSGSAFLLQTADFLLVRCEEKKVEHFRFPSVFGRPSETNNLSQSSSCTIDLSVI